MAKLGRPRSHELIRTPTYSQWALIKQSCNNPRSKLYKYIGAHGIGYIKRWENFAAFVEDMGEKPAGATLQRKDRRQDFSPVNCFWEPRQNMQTKEPAQ